MYENFKQGEISINLKEISEESEHVMLSSLNSKRDIKVTSNLEKNHFTVDISLNIKGAILEYVGDLRLANDKDIKELEGIVSQYVNEQAKIMIKEMQKNNVDSLGMGKYVRNSLTYNQWSNLVWHDHYPNVEVLCNTKVSIKDYGKFGN
ncbi:MAG: Ger(x)C family spore germination C-terminal domain-containing protein [Candidatus Pristimantibacillus lignocellulolyticus]|uniref:Ger(X)C family spore germination C-terminal domain-containing protein n=1 Tax=Candidatus Pristimantibacillus lignocellulolyticus TaxID=2994561 RepID=A0A9J6ZCV3_9BACL|nr:MAG: Ger(x)C family spore germination C-terminal domain-containing protein [Candidatus Pristimantibacillus lignocellulolyticus]